MPEKILSVQVFNLSFVDKLIYVQSNPNLNWDSYIWSPTKQISQLDASSDFIEVIKLLYNVVPETSINCFTAYHLYYKKIFGMTECIYNPLFLRSPQLLSLPGD